MTTAQIEEGALAKSVQSGERRQRIRQTVQELIKQRQQVFVKYCELAGVASFDQREQANFSISSDRLSAFIQILVDYTALGHFEVYQRIIEGQERRIAVRGVAARVYPAIAETTDYLIDFNDKYEGFGGEEEDLDALKEDLPKLGQVLAVRGDLEDEILSALQLP